MNAQYVRVFSVCWLLLRHDFSSERNVEGLSLRTQLVLHNLQRSVTAERSETLPLPPVPPHTVMRSCFLSDLSHFHSLLEIWMPWSAAEDASSWGTKHHSYVLISPLLLIGFRPILLTESGVLSPLFYSLLMHLLPFRVQRLNIHNRKQSSINRWNKAQKSLVCVCSIKVYPQESLETR